MTTTQIFENGDGQSVRLPNGFEFATSEVAIRRQGEAVIIEPLGVATWPVGFFDQIRVNDPTFCRPDQGGMPAAPQIGGP